MSTDPRFQIAVEAPDEAVRLIRIAGDLDRSAAARLLRLVDAQLDLVAARHRSVSHVLVDLECVRSFEPGGLDAVREARRTSAARGVRLHLVGCAGRSPLLPLRVCQVLAEFSTFPTVEIALAELSRTCATAPPETAALVRAGAVPAGAAEGQGNTSSMMTVTCTGSRSVSSRTRAMTVSRTRSPSARRSMP